MRKEGSDRMARVPICGSGGHCRKQHLNHCPLLRVWLSWQASAGQPPATMLQLLNLGAGATEVFIRLHQSSLSLGSAAEDWLLCFQLGWGGHRSIPIGPVATDQAVCLPVPAYLHFSTTLVEDMVVTRCRRGNGSHSCCKENNSSVASAVHSLLPEFPPSPLSQFLAEAL